METIPSYYEQKDIITEVQETTQKLEPTVESYENDLAPVFITPLYDYEVELGADVVIRVEVEAFPPAKFIWYIDGEEVETSDRLRIKSVANKSTLKLFGVSRPIREISVIALNRAGSASCSGIVSSNLNI